MKVAVTGHTSGIGKACFEYFNSIGFSRSNGFNNNKPTDIINSLEDSNVFINCAHGGFGQAIMMKAIFDRWRNEEKHIINIGVTKVDVRCWELVHESYSVEKLAAHAMVDQCQSLKRNCRITNLCLGVVENYNGPITYDQIIETIIYVLNSKYEIKEIVL